MPLGIGTVAVVAVVSASLGAWGGAYLTRDKGDDHSSAEVIDASAGLVEVAATGTTEALTVAVAEDLAHAETERAIATRSAPDILAQTVADAGCLPATLALAEYTSGVSAVQGKQGSAAVNLEEAQQDVAKVIDALLTNPALCPAPIVLDMIAVDEIDLNQ